MPLLLTAAGFLHPHLAFKEVQLSRRIKVILFLFPYLRSVLCVGMGGWISSSFNMKSTHSIFPKVSWGATHIRFTEMAGETCGLVMQGHLGAKGFQACGHSPRALPCTTAGHCSQEERQLLVQSPQPWRHQGAFKNGDICVPFPRFCFHGSGVQPGHWGFGKLCGDFTSALGQCFSALAPLASA